MSIPRVVLVLVVAALALGGALVTAALANRIVTPIAVVAHHN